MYIMHFNEPKEETTDVVDTKVVHAEVDETGIVTVYCDKDESGSLWYFTLTSEDMKIIQNPEDVSI